MHYPKKNLDQSVHKIFNIILLIEALVLPGDYVFRDNLNVVLDALILPHVLCLITTTNNFWSDIADVSETKTLVIAFARETPPSPSSEVGKMDP